MTNPSSSGSELEPCPFCGGRADYDETAVTHHMYVECLGGCGARGGFSESLRGAIAAWNRRAPAPAGGSLDPRDHSDAANIQRAVERAGGIFRGGPPIGPLEGTFPTRCPWCKEDGGPCVHCEGGRAALAAGGSVGVEEALEDFDMILGMLPADRRYVEREIERVRAALRAHVGKPGETETDHRIALCEAGHIIPYVGRTYQFYAVPGCAKCEEMAAAYDDAPPTPEAEQPE